MMSTRARQRMHTTQPVRWSVPVFLDTELGCQLTELPIS